MTRAIFILSWETVLIWIGFREKMGQEYLDNEYRQNLNEFCNKGKERNRIISKGVRRAKRGFMCLYGRRGMSR